MAPDQSFFPEKKLQHCKINYHHKSILCIRMDTNSMTLYNTRTWLTEYSGISRMLIHPNDIHIKYIFTHYFRQ